jgi:Asp-tRNA(Asn)/Glu-tRNA(Gln) amidotransferase A subunit family amidase
MGPRFSEPLLIRVASRFEAATKARKPPRFIRPGIVI